SGSADGLLPSFLVAFGVPVRRGEYTGSDSLDIQLFAGDALHSNCPKFHSAGRRMGNIISADSGIADTGLFLLRPECDSDAQDAVQGIGGSDACFLTTLSRLDYEGSPAAPAQSRPADSAHASSDNRADHIRIRFEPESSRPAHGRGG